MKSVLYIVVPCYNEEACLDETTKRLTKKLEDLISSDLASKKSRIVYVDDGSKDNTWNKIKELKEIFENGAL